MIVSLIVAVANNNGIGKDNNLLWHLPADMKFFRETTTGHCIITGRKNYESIPPRFRPLNGRTNIVLTRNLNYGEPNIEICNSIETAIELAEKQHEKEVFVIGGGQIYKEVLEKNLVDRMYISHVDVNLEADTFFPKFKKENWRKSLLQEQEPDGKNKFGFRVIKYDRV